LNLKKWDASTTGPRIQIIRKVVKSRWSGSFIRASPTLVRVSKKFHINFGHTPYDVHSTVSRILWTNLSVVNYVILGLMHVQQCHDSQNLVNYPQSDDRAEYTKVVSE